MRNASRATRAGRLAESSASRPRAAISTATASRLQRKAGSCACGGDCPRCATPASSGGLTIGAVDDPLEREADRVADQVMAMRDPAAPSTAAPGMLGGELLQRQPMEEEEEAIQAKPAEGAAGLLQRESEEEEEMIQPKAADGAAADNVAGGDFSSRVSALRGGGQSMPDSQRGYFEPRFGRSFDNVRLHTGPEADNLTREAGALAFTVGGDIAFRSDAYRPGSQDGRRLIAHELTHVVQQGAAREAGEGDGESEHGTWSRGPPIAASSDQEHLRRKELIYASGYPNRFRNDRAEVGCFQSKNCEWFPSTDDFKAAAKRSGGGTGKKSVKGLLDFIDGKAAGSIEKLGLLGHANSQAFALGGKILADDVEFAKDATLYSKALKDNKTRIAGLRDRFKDKSEIILYGCNAGVDSTFLDTLGDAFGTCVKGFSDEVLSCITWSTPSLKITSRGRVVIDDAGLVGAGLMSCGEFKDKVWSLSPDQESSSCKKKAKGASATSMVHEAAHAGALVQPKIDPAARNQARRSPVPVQGRAAPRLQRHPVYISKHGSKPHLDNAAVAFRQWGYAPLKTGVDSIEEVVADLAKKSSIGRVTLVSHAHPNAVMMSMLSGGPGAVEESDWRVDLREEPPLDLDALPGQRSKRVLPKDPKEIVKLERHFFEAATAATAISHARRKRKDRKRIDRIGKLDDPAVNQFLWWAMELAWLPKSGLTKNQRRALARKIKKHLANWQRAIVALARRRKKPVPKAADFAAARAAMARGVKAMKRLDKVRRGDRKEAVKKLGGSPSGPVSRALLKPTFSRNLERVRRKIRNSSWIEIQGCRAGSSRSYLEAMKDFFSHGARQPKVTAPDWFQAYGKLGWKSVGTDRKTLRRRLKSRRTRRALKYWYPIVMGKPLSAKANPTKALQRYLKSPNVLPLVVPGAPGEKDAMTKPGAESAFLIPTGLQEAAFLRWLSLHSYRLTRVSAIRKALFDPKGSAAANIAGARVDYLQEGRNFPTRVLYRPDPAYKNHIIKV